MGSVKDLHEYIPATEQSLGRGDFVFSDRFSVFDWGEMPDHIQNKGAALCIIAAYNFEKLQQRGFHTHYLGVRNAYGETVRLDKITKPTNEMTVSLSRVYKPTFTNGSFDYSYFTNGRGKINNFVVPLEVIYRNGAPKGSSLFKTLATLEDDGKTQEKLSLLAQYGLTENPRPGDLFPQTGFDFTTKFEPTDRKISDDDAYTISGLTQEQFYLLKNIRQAAVEIVSQRAEEVGLQDFDGKHEYRLFNGEVAMADVFGTLDENRFMFEGRQVSKEFLRQIYKTKQADWIEDIERAKKEAKQNKMENWKSLVTIQPQKLDPQLIKLVGEMYAAAAEKYTGLPLFGVRSLEEVMQDLEPFYSQN
ncbi:MAG: phosphoribosylaminoimidazolesuccinocarboxamide synthase [Nanoarchaeota archaeon]